MSFFNLSDNSELDTSGSFSSQEEIKPIPAKTKVKAAIEEVKWDEYEGDEYINITWSVLDGEYKNRKIFQKVRVKDSDAKKRDKAIRMLVAIDSNAKGGLVALGREPMEHELQSALMHKPMCIMLQVWKIDDKEGNWVSAVSPAASYTPPAATQPQDSEEDDDFFDI
jgi:hypothetical protein